jgi:hypothetical protein
MGLEIAKVGLTRALNDTVQGVNRAFPGLQEACWWLEKEIEQGRLTIDDPVEDIPYHCLTPDQRTLQIQRDNILEEFATIASERHYDCYGYAEEWDGSDPDDNDDEEEQHGQCRSVDVGLYGWAAVVRDWPDKEAAKEILDTLRRDIFQVNFFHVDGVVERLASRYDSFLSLRGAVV